MEHMNLNHMSKGWFIGNFDPSLIKTDDFEVAVKYYSAGDYEAKHLHKISREITVIVDGIAEMNGVQYKTGDIIDIKPNEATDFRAITDVKTTVVKIPSVKNDKYLVTE